MTGTEFSFGAIDCAEAFSEGAPFHANTTTPATASSAAIPKATVRFFIMCNRPALTSVSRFPLSPVLSRLPSPDPQRIYHIALQPAPSVPGYNTRNFNLLQILSAAQELGHAG
jgi:hypothetical protein